MSFGNKDDEVLRTRTLQTTIYTITLHLLLLQALQALRGIQPSWALLGSRGPRFRPYMPLFKGLFMALLGPFMAFVPFRYAWVWYLESIPKWDAILGHKWTPKNGVLSILGSRGSPPNSPPLNGGSGVGGLHLA